MSDLIYVSLILAAFVALLGYVRFCAWAGRQDPDAPSQEASQ